MSCLENDKIKEELWEDFCELFVDSPSFCEQVTSLFSKVDAFLQRECGRYDNRALGEVFDRLWNNDCELFCADKRMALEAYTMFQDSMKIFKEIGGKK